MQSASTAEELQTLLNRDDFNFRFHCGYTKPTALISLADKEELVRSIWLHCMLFHPHAELQLQKSLNQTLQFDILVCMHPTEVWGVLAASTAFDVTSRYLCDEVAVQYSDNGSNKCTKEEAIVFFWYEYSATEQESNFSDFENKCS